MWTLLMTLPLLLSSTIALASETKILVIYESTNEATLKLATAIAKGASANPNTEVILKRIPDQIKVSELADYDGLALGSPVHFGSMTGQMKLFLDQSLELWKTRALEGKPATVFMSAGSGAGNETAILNVWSVLAAHGMVIVPLGQRGQPKTPSGHSPYGITTLSAYQFEAEELKAAELQGTALARIAEKLKAPDSTMNLPPAPKAVGNYLPFKKSGKYVYINQIALENGVVPFPGIIGDTVSNEEAILATRLTTLNVLAVLKEAAGGDLRKVKQAVQITGHFSAISGFKDHSLLMNEASELIIKALGEKGQHARGAMGSASLPLNSPVELQAIFELK